MGSKLIKFAKNTTMINVCGVFLQNWLKARQKTAPLLIKEMIFLRDNP